MPRLWGRQKAARSRSRLGVHASEAPTEELVRQTTRSRIAAHRLPGLLLVALGLLMLRHLLMGPRFVVREVEVTGTQMLAPDAVRDGVTLAGRNVFAINERQVERGLTERYVCVQAAIVDCRLPGACKVQVNEVSDVVIWEQGGEAWWVALDGLVLGPVTVATEAPTLRNKGPMLTPQDGYLVGVPWRYALAAGRALQDGEQLEFMPGYGLVLHLGEQRLPVYLGEQGDVRAKLALAIDTVAEAERRGLGLGYIDLRSEARPIIGGL